MTNPIAKNHAPLSAKPEQGLGRRRITSQQLFEAQNEVVIEHMGEEYRLRITSNGKLILTK
ncbi:hemin uptake protein HemP [Methylomonas sp. LL1]|uniref:hemin uptake protein HemP n=1 Tax=Methylomonas sp. LL1 TaxID=2785785 RepID=UPI0018C3B525|nr:hemin uptake protein HemP [Methylomonas sp. LL1]